MRPRAGATALAALLTASASPALALAAPSSTEQRAGLLPVQFEGDFNDAWRARLLEELEQSLTDTGLSVVDPQTVTEASGGVGDCRNAKCFQFLSESTDARFLVRTKVEVAERNYELTLDIIDGRDGSLAATSKESCQLCGLAEVGELVAKQAAVLRQKIDVLALAPAVVTITTEPTGATILIDGQTIGSAPLEHELTPGSHRARARKDGYIEQTRTIETVQGVREQITFELVPMRGSKRPARGDWKPPLGWSLVGVGGAGLASGITFLAIDEVPYRARCSGSDIDAQGNCRQRYNTQTLGIALTATSAALLAAGATLLIVTRLRRGRCPDAMARRLQLGPGTLGGRF
ncbi:MAG: PEGA domain-containing protein [Myxococcota bacterium]